MEYGLVLSNPVPFCPSFFWICSFLSFKQSACCKSGLGGTL